MRLFTEQLEAMSKLKGKVGQQKVTVEHVHVHDGGQAIVGAVSTGKPDRGEGDK
jgi:GTPase